MKSKYLVNIYKDDELQESKSFKTRTEITTQYNIPLYIVDKIIKINNDTSFITKRKSHRIFQELISTMKIILIKPTI